VSNPDPQNLFEDNNEQRERNQEAIAKDGEPIEQCRDQLARSPWSIYCDQVRATLDIGRQACNRIRTTIRCKNMNQATDRAYDGHKSQKIER
jgi:hypothetical protein